MKSYQDADFSGWVWDRQSAVVREQLPALGAWGHPLVLKFCFKAYPTAHVFSVICVDCIEQGNHIYWRDGMGSESTLQNEILIICYNMDGFCHHYAYKISQIQKDKYYVIPLIPRVCISVESWNRMEVTRGWGKQELLFSNVEFLLGMMTRSRL